MYLEKINKAKQLFTRSVEEGNASKLKDVYDINGEILCDGGIIIKGVEEIIAKIKNFMELVGAYSIKLDAIDCWEHGDVVYEKGQFSLTNKNTGKIFHAGYYIIIWRLQVDGSYKVYREIKIDRAVTS